MDIWGKTLDMLWFCWCNDFVSAIAFFKWYFFAYIAENLRERISHLLKLLTSENARGFYSDPLFPRNQCNFLEQENGLLEMNRLATSKTKL